MDINCFAKEITHVSFFTIVYIFYTFFMIFVIRKLSSLFKNISDIDLSNPDSFKEFSKKDDLVLLSQIITVFVVVSILYLSGKSMIADNNIIASPIDRCGPSLGSRNGVIVTTFFLYSSLGELKGGLVYLIQKYL